MTGLHKAAQTGNIRKAHQLMAGGLLRKPANPNACSEDGATPLHLAALAGHCAVVECLLKNGANPSVAKASGETPLLLAVTHGRSDVVRVLIRSGAVMDPATEATLFDALMRTPSLSFAHAFASLAGSRAQSVSGALEQLRDALERMHAGTDFSDRNRYDITTHLPALLDHMEHGRSYELIVTPQRGHTQAATKCGGCYGAWWGDNAGNACFCTDYILEDAGHIEVRTLL